MANKIKVTLTDDMIKLIKCITYKDFSKVRENDQRQEVNLGIDMNNIYGGSFLYEDMSFILGFYDKRIEDSENGWDGPRFSKELEDYMFDTHQYLMDNILYIEQILHQNADTGIKAGTYESRDNEMIWKYVEKKIKK